MAQIKVSLAYWNSLSEKEKIFLQQYAHDYGVRYCKRIITLARNFRYDEIANFSEYTKNKDNVTKLASRYVWVIFRSGKMIGTISKCEGYGISEKITIKTDGKIHEVWNNFYNPNPKREVILQINNA